MGRNKQSEGHGLVEGMPRLLGDRLCLDFLNTIEAPQSTAPQDFLTSTGDLLRWGNHVGGLTVDDLQAAQSRITRDLDDDDSTLGSALALRARLTAIFRRVANGLDPRREDLALLTAAYREGLSGVRMRLDGQGRGWVWAGPSGTPEQVLWAVLASAVDVLMRDDLSRIHECPGAGDCGWLFFDASRNGTRRWCSMEGCGSRVKMRRHYARHRGNENG